MVESVIKMVISKTLAKYVFIFTSILYQMPKIFIWKETYVLKIKSCNLFACLWCIKYQKVNAKCLTNGIF